MRSKLVQLAAAALVLLAVPLAASARPAASPRPLKGIYDATQLIFGNPDTTFKQLAQLRTKVVRAQLIWGGRGGVARRKPEHAADPADPAYDWSRYDRLATYAAKYKIKVMFSIWGTPAWANGRRAQRFAPRRAIDLRSFAAAAAKRYSGKWAPEASEEETETHDLPKVDYWLAWNEPNNPIFLSPQFRRVGRRYVVQSARDYAKICNAVVAGVHSVRAGQKVACGVTAPRGNNQARGPRPSVSPVFFLAAIKRAGARGFDAYAHHPYYGSPREGPRVRPPARTAITLGNIDVLIRELTRFYGRKPLWITEYGYQTNPPDRIFGVSPKRQAQYLAQSYAIVRKNRRIQMFVWFLLRDERRLSGWQSGLETVGGRKKPAYNVFRRLG